MIQMDKGFYLGVLWGSGFMGSMHLIDDGKFAQGAALMAISLVGFVVWLIVRFHEVRMAKTIAKLQPGVWIRLDQNGPNGWKDVGIQDPKL